MLGSQIRLRPAVLSLLALALAAGLSVTASAPAAGRTPTPQSQSPLLSSGERDASHVQRASLAMKDRAPLPSSKDEGRDK